MNRGAGHVVAGTSGIIAAALGANSQIFAMRADPSNGPLCVFVEHVHIAWNTIVAFTTPITAARRLALYRAAAGVATGGTTLAAIARDSANAIAAGALSDARIATTAALATPPTRENDPQGQFVASHLGAAGAFGERFFEWHASWGSPLILNPGESLVLSNPVAMDAGGTFQISVSAQYSVAAAVT